MPPEAVVFQLDTQFFFIHS
uniref:Uncharacterized protein n=1 Tax=Anguilla anguilla TaxID=7936 RepID=A0A0E9SI58_ANGAN